MADVYKLTKVEPIKDNRITLPVTEALISLNNTYHQLEDLYGIGNVKIAACVEDELMLLAKQHGLRTDINVRIPQGTYYVMEQRPL